MKKRVPSEQEIAKKHGVSVDYVIRQAEIGSTVEREHVTDHKAAYGIALQHIAEFPDYYKHLLGMEKKLKKEWDKKQPIKENVSTGNARRARMGGVKQRVGSSEVISNRDVANAAQKSADAKKSAGDAAHAAATKAGKSPMEAETARNRAHREYEKAQKKSRLNSSYILSFGEYIKEGAAWTKKEGQNSEGGLNEKGRKSYERENPGSDLKAPSKKVGNPRRASFCARMRGMRKRQKPSNNTGEDRLSKSLRAWNC